MKKWICIFMSLLMIFGIFAVSSVTAAYGDQAGRYALVTLKGAMGESVTKAYAVGDTITAYSYLNASALNGGKIGSISAFQFYTDSILTLTEEMDTEGIIMDNEPVFPILKKGSCIGRSAASGAIRFNSTLASLAGFSFDNDSAALVILRYRVDHAGTATIENVFNAMALSDLKLTPIIVDGTILNDDFTAPVALSDPVLPVENDCSISGNVKSFLSDDSPVTVMLSQIGSDSADPVKGYGIYSLTPGIYTLTVSKKDHVTREYTGAVLGTVQMDVELHPIGDINGDGKTNAKDLAMANAHVQKVRSLSDYALNCADVVKGDGKVLAADVARINSHIQKISLLY